MILCKSRNRVIVEYALRDTAKPIGISKFTVTKSLPEDLKANLPTIEDLEAELVSMKPDEAPLPGQVDPEN
jgi:hypothetical protein